MKNLKYLIIPFFMMGCLINTLEITPSVENYKYASGDVFYYSSDFDLTWTSIDDLSGTIYKIQINDEKPVDLKDSKFNVSSEGLNKIKVYAYNQKLKKSGGFEVSIYIDKTPPAVENIGFKKNVVFSLISKNYVDVKEGEHKISDAGGINIASIKTFWKNPDALPTTKGVYNIPRIFSVTDRAGNKTEVEYTITTIDEEVYPQEILITNPGPLSSPAVLNFTVNPANADNKNVSFEYNATNGFFTFDTATKIITPIATGSSDITIKSISKPDVTATVTISVVIILPDLIEITDPGIVFEPTVLTYAVRPDTTSNKSVTFEYDTANGFFTFDATTKTITPIAKGSSSITIKSVANSAITNSITINVDPDYKYFFGKTKTLVKMYDFKGLSALPTGWEKVMGNDLTFLAEGINLPGNHGKTCVQIDASSIGEFNYVEFKYKHSAASTTYSSNYYVVNMAHEWPEPVFVFAYRKIQGLGFCAPNWSSLAADKVEPDNITESEWTVVGGFERNFTSGTLICNNKKYVQNHGNGSNQFTLYNGGENKVRLGIENDGGDAGITITFEYIAFYKYE